MLNTNFRQDDRSANTPELRARRMALAISISSITQRLMLGVAVLLFIAWLVLRPYTQILIYALAVAGMCAVSWAYGHFVNRGRGTLGGVLYLSWFLFLTLVCVLLVPEALGSAIVCYIFVVLLSNFFFGYRGFLACITASLVLFVLDMLYVYTPSSYWFPELPYNLGLVIGIANGGFSLLVVCVYIRMIIVNQESLFVFSEEAKQAVERQVAMERARRILVQQTVNDYVDMMNSVGKGNLSVRIPVDEQAAGEEDPLITLGKQINQAVANLEVMINQIGEASSHLSASSSEILASVTQQVSGSVEQSSAITQTNATVQEVRAIAEQTVQRAQEVVIAAQQAAEVSRSGQASVQETILGMNRIRERVEGISLNILELSEQTQRIGEIIESVSVLASQSNLLALNAAVEAAHAGEHGKGFAVVAAEVRSLAEQSKQATLQVKEILQQIQKATNASVMTTEEGLKVVEQGVQLTMRTQETIEQLAHVIAESVNRMQQVKAGGNQQAMGIEQVSLAIQNIQTVSVQSLASTRQAEQSAQDLNQLALRLNQTLSRYERKESSDRVDFAVARLNHKNWVKRMNAFMEGKGKLTVEAVVSHTECDLGKWLYATALPKYRNNAELIELERIHEDFHNGLKQVVRLKQAGQHAQAESELLAVQKLTDRIFKLLSIAEQREGESVPESV